jgi:outer membrane protein assembly factor BamB
MLIAAVLAAPPEPIWWVDLDAPSLGSAAVGDIDGDTLPEVVFGTYFNDESIHALNGEDGSPLWSYDTGGCNDASPAIADVDLDGELEVIVPSSSPFTVYCFDGRTGDVEWTRSTGFPNCIDSPPAIADVDDDGLPEIVLGTFYGHVFCLNGEDGSIEWHIELGEDSYIQSGPNILDLDGDGRLDVVVAQWAGAFEIHALRGHDGSSLWHSEAPTDHMYHGGSFGDIDEDGRPEVVIGCYDNMVRLLEGESGDVGWDYPAPFYVGAPTSLGDLDGDDHLEVAFASWNQVGTLTNDGDLEWSRTVGGGSFRGSAIADVDGNFVPDLIFGADDGLLYARRGDNGGEVWTYDVGAHYGREFRIDHAPVIADLDGDGDLDAFVVGGHATSSEPEQNHGRAYALTAGEGTGPGWPMFRRDLRHSACYECCEPAGPFRLLAPENPATDLLLPNVLFDWEDSPGAVSYDLFLGPTTPPPLYAAGIVGSEFLAGPLEPGAVHHWWVRAKGGCGDEPSMSGVWRLITTSMPMSVTHTSVRARRSGDDLVIHWGEGCGAADDYTIYEGDLQALAAGTYTHASKVCTDADADRSETFPPSPGDRYYLVVPRTATGVEGSYGPGRPSGTDAASCGLTGWLPGECP